MKNPNVVTRKQHFLSKYIINETILLKIYLRFILTRTKTSIRYAKENDREGERERER